MEFNINEDCFGKIILHEKRNTLYYYIIVGYDMLKKQYLVIDIIDESMKYQTISHIDEYYSYNELVEIINDYINHYSHLKEIILEKEAQLNKEIKDGKRQDTLGSIFHRLKSCQQNVTNNEAFAQFSNYNNELYEREAQKSQKGLKRALKRLYSVFEFEEYYEIVEFLEDHKYDISKLETTIDNLIRKKDYLIKYYKEFNEKYKNN